MPCITEPPSHEEEESRRLNDLLDEIDDQTPREYGGNIYGKMRRLSLDEMTQRLCAWSRSHDVTKYSLELQIWWRDHQKFDRQREQLERAEKERYELARSASAKLTPDELTALLHFHRKH